MINYKRLGFHLLFWIIYFSISLFTELYLSSSQNLHPSAGLVYDVMTSQLLLLIVKVPAVYYTLYSLIPRWVKTPRQPQYFIEAVIAFCFFLVVYRALIHLLIWPYVTDSFPRQLTNLQFAARLFYSAFDLLQVVGIIAAIKLFRLRIAAVKNEKALIREKHQSEMQHLKSQVNPHFLFNMLNSIYALSRSQSASTPDVVMKLSSILRFLLYETGKNTISIEQELKIVNDYIELQQLRFGNRIKVTIESDIENSNTNIAPLMLFPLIENAFKHGNVEGTAEILFQVSLNHHILVVNVTNPVGKSSVIQNKEEGIGLPNLRRQLELLYRDHSFKHEKIGSHFYVNLQINLESYVGFELFDSRG